MHLTAVVDADLRTIRGTLTLPEGLELVSPLPLPQPDDDLTLIRTFPGRVDQGSMRFERSGDHWTFETRLPRRYGSIGSTSHGLYALGGFSPQPLLEGKPLPVEWVVDVTLPEDHLGLVGQVVGRGRVHWEGLSERVALALPRRAKLWTSADGRVQVLGKGRPRGVFRRQLNKVLQRLNLEHPLVVVETPLRRRLHQHAPGILFASDRYFQLTFPFSVYHRPALVEGLVAADSNLPDPLLRDLVGRAAALEWEEHHRGLDAVGVTKALSFIPSIDALLSSRRMAFYSETFREWTPSDGLRDDLFEVLAPVRPGSSVAGQVESRSDRQTLYRLARALREGGGLAESLQRVGLDPGLAPLLRAPVPTENYALEVGSTARVSRNVEGGGDAPPEMLEVQVDRELRVFEMSAGETIDLGPVKRVVLDPSRKLDQPRMGDAYPLERIRIVTAIGINTLNLTQFRLEGGGVMWLRGRNDTHNLFQGAISTTRSSIAALRLKYTYGFGPLRYGITRRHRWSVSGGPSWVNGRYQSLEDGRWVLSGRSSWSWSNRVSAEFPLQGTSLGLTLDGGIHPGTAARWGSVRGHISNIQSPHPRHALSWSATGGVARGSRSDRLLPLGGSGQMASLAPLSPCSITDEGEPCMPRALEMGVLRGEYRLVAIRGARVPLVGVWGRELILSTGVEAMAAGLQRGRAQALGVLVGVSAVYDLFGADPGVVGLTAAWPLAVKGLEEVTVGEGRPEIYLRWSTAL